MSIMWGLAQISLVTSLKWRVLYVALQEDFVFLMAPLNPLQPRIPSGTWMEHTLIIMTITLALEQIIPQQNLQLTTARPQLILGIVPFLLSFFPPLRLYRNMRALFYSITLILVIFGAWDIFATFRGHWYFNPTGVWELRVVNLPIEEVLFFVIIPFCCIFTWEAINYIKHKLPWKSILY